MRLLGIILVVGLAFYGAFSFGFPTYTHRYRLTIEVDTPQGLRGGSTVIEVKRLDQRWVLIAQGRYVFLMSGEAAFVDLGEGRNVFAILAFGPFAENVDQHISLWVEAYGQSSWDEDVWAGRRRLRDAVELRPPLIPTLVTFADMSDPNTARVIQPGEFEAMFGPGYHLKGVRLEMTSVGVTRKIETVLPWLSAIRAGRNGGSIRGHPGRFILNAPYFKRGS